MLVPVYEAVGKSNEEQETSVMVIRASEYILTKHWLPLLHLILSLRHAIRNFIYDLKFLGSFVSFTSNYGSVFWNNLFVKVLHHIYELLVDMFNLNMMELISSHFNARYIHFISCT